MAGYLLSRMAHGLSTVELLTAMRRVWPDLLIFILQVRELGISGTKQFDKVCSVTVLEVGLKHVCLLVCLFVFKAYVLLSHKLYHRFQ